MVGKRLPDEDLVTSTAGVAARCRQQFHQGVEEDGVDAGEGCAARGTDLLQPLATTADGVTVVAQSSGTADTVQADRALGGHLYGG